MFVHALEFMPVTNAARVSRLDSTRQSRSLSALNQMILTIRGKRFGMVSNISAIHAALSPPDVEQAISATKTGFADSAVTEEYAALYKSVKDRQLDHELPVP